MSMRAKLFSLISVLFLLILFYRAGAAFAENTETTVHIRSKSDFLQLAADCALDSWSKGVTVELETDLDFGGEDILPIPSFSGTFHGNGHEIRGLTLSTDGSNQALFRYVTVDAIIDDLTVEGSITPTYGRLRVAGIAGTNWGRIENCSFTGSVAGLNYVGGLVGENHGSVDRCRFSGSVDGKRFSGGIVGYNDGLVSSCVNKGDVNVILTVEAPDLADLATASNGLALNLRNAEDENVISDTGGIVGFSKGIVISCSNFGMIGYPHYGYNVGGIAGRQSGYLSECRNSGQVYGKKDVAGIVGQMEPYLDLIKTTNLADELLMLNKYLNNASGDISNLAAEFRNLQKDIDAEEYSFSGISINEGNIYHADENVPASTGSSSEGIISSGDGGNISPDDLSDFPTNGTIEEMADWINTHTGSSNEGTITPADGSVDLDYQDYMDSINSSWLSDGLDARMSELAGRLGDVYNALQSSGSDLAYDLTQANDQFSRILLLMANALNGSPQTDLFEDVSEKLGESASEGLVSSNINYGSVEADNNVGGIAGAMGIEYEFDLEDSLAQIVGANGIISNTYNTNCVNSGNVNYASVQGKKDRIGGAVGSEESGTVIHCESYGSISSTDGNYVGGIAGFSSTSIHDSYAFCLVNGVRYVGGVVGFGKNILDSVSMIETDTSGAFVGAVAGWADMDEEENDIAGNFYVNESLGAIDGISYVGRAEPIGYDELIVLPGIPDGFRQVTLNFFVDGRLIDSLRLEYGGSVEDSRLPAVPIRSGYTGSWGDFDHRNIRFSRDIEAIYTLNHSTIAAEQTRENSPLSIALLEGSFADADALALAPYQGDSPSIPEKQVVETWELTLSGVSAPDTVYLVRYLPPEELQGKEVAIYYLKDGEWISVETDQSGSYLVFPAAGNHIVFSAVSSEARQTFPTKWIALTAGSGGCLLILLIAIILSHRKKKLAGKHNTPVDSAAGQDSPGLG